MNRVGASLSIHDVRRHGETIRVVGRPEADRERYMVAGVGPTQVGTGVAREKTVGPLRTFHVNYLSRTDLVLLINQDLDGFYY